MTAAPFRQLQALWLVLALFFFNACGPKNTESGVEGLDADQCYAPAPGHPTTSERSAWIAASIPYAQAVEQTYGVPAGAILAMSAVESGYGWTKTALSANNPFGFKYTSAAAAGGRGYYTLACQPAADPNNKYIAFASMRDAFLFVAERLAVGARYKSVTDAYKTRGALDVVEATNQWIDGIADAGYNYDPSSYKVKLRKVANNYQTPSLEFSSTYNTYQYSEQRLEGSP